MRERIWFSFILCLPFDSFPFAPGGVIKPLCIYPALLYFFFFFKPKFILKINTFQTLIFVLLLILQSFFVSAFIIEDLIGSWKFLYNLLLIFLFVFFVTDYYNSLDEKNRSEIWKKFSNYFLISSYIPILLGLIQLFFPFVGLGSVSKSISLLFVSKITQRIQLTSSEPAYASVYLLSVIIIGYYFSTGKYRVIYKRLLPFLILLFLAVGSTFGLLTVVIIPVLFVFLFRKRAIVKMMLLIGIVLVIFYSLFGLMPEYTQNRLLAIISILKDSSIFIKLIAIDDSIFLRIINPYIGYLIFKESYFLGVGGENSYYLFPYFIQNDYPQVVNNVQIHPIVIGEIRTSPKNLYTKILAEFGLFFGTYILYFGVKLSKSLKGNVGLQIVFCMFLAFSLQLDSYSFPLFLTILVLLFFSGVSNVSSNKLR
ncbi:hypothetical protein MM239_09810 [Belliella sp. DSM 111904]|uniref:O-antigen ligase-related domain-containing protein n=1 Tax=Belliella filtrata TaxID=2923435 RepID=A0ABS9V0D5_9BACT|nr:O-antigen ligase family protein [Belliella filtrata]MCH7409689.1 hypothetical protein [Belliella filtrata]